MTSDLDSVLEDCLIRLEQGETLQACLLRYPEQAAELKLLLRAAARFDEEQTQMRPSAAFRAQTRTKLYAHMEAHPQKKSHWWQVILPAPNIAFGMATLLMLAFMFTGTVFAQSALPGAAFYPWKLITEQIWRAVSPDPVGVDLSLAERRVDEIVAVSGNTTAREIGIEEYQQILKDLGKYQGLAVQARIEQALLMQEQRLKSTGILLVDQKTPIPTTIISPTQIPPTTKKTLPSPKQTLPPPATLIPTHVIPTILPATLPRLSTAVPTILRRIPTALRTIIPLLPTIPGLP